MPIIGSDVNRVELINLLNGASDAAYTLASLTTTQNSLPRGICWDGNKVHASWFFASGDNRLAHSKPAGTSFDEDEEELLTGTVWLDIKFDGLYWWFLDATNVRAKAGPRHLDTTVIGPWAHGVVAPRSIMFQGDRIVILAAA